MQKKAICPKYPFRSMIEYDLFGNPQSLSMREVLQKTILATRKDTPVAILGEFSTGKSWLAHKIHHLSKFTNDIYYELDCIKMHPDQIRNELLGRMQHNHDGGHITHNAFNYVNHGTLFVKSFNALSTELQHHLVHLVEHFTTTTIFNARQDPVNVRVIVSVDYKAYEGKKSDIQALLEQINPIYISQPPLRKRREDIPMLVNSFLEELSQRYNRQQIPHVHPSVLYSFLLYDWPGNLRQLQNTLEYALIISNEAEIKSEHLPPVFKNQAGSHYSRSLVYNEDSFLRAEKMLCQKVLNKNGSLRKTALELGINYSTLKKIIK